MNRSACFFLRIFLLVSLLPGLFVTEYFEVYINVVVSMVEIYVPPNPSCNRLRPATDEKYIEIVS
jgi:hypothetical protein